MFAWKACKEDLPTLSNLKKKKNVLIEDNCCLCNVSVENLPHALFWCPQISNYWSSLFPMMGEMGRKMSMMDIAMKIYEGGRDEDLAIFFLLAWGF